jgi:hypothetical protein
MATQISKKCEPIQKTLEGLEKKLTKLQNELKGKPGGPIQPKPEIIKAIATTTAKIKTTQAQLQECNRKNPPEPLPLPPPEIVTPDFVLETNYKNPAFDTSDPDWAAKLAGGGKEPFGTFPLGSGPEWKQVLAPDEDYDLDKVGASGWVLNAHTTNKDFPFNHPFGKDWEFAFAVDEKYNGLVAKGNIDQAKAEFKLAKDWKIAHSSNGLFGVEMESNLIPESFRNAVGRGDGNRAVVFGRWIVDCGHDRFRTEIHPPLLMAVAKAMDKDAEGLLGSRTLFTSRPYLTGQKFTTNTDTIYEDGKDETGFFLEHALKEIRDLLGFVDIPGPIPIPIPIPLSLTFSARPKIKSKPFDGIQSASMVIRPASRRPTFSPLQPNPYKLSVSYNFTVRSGCAIRINQIAEDTIEVTVVLNPLTYKAPPLPNREDISFSTHEISELSETAGILHFFSPVLLPVIAPALGPLLANPLALANFTQAVARGVRTDAYTPLQVDVTHTKNQVKNVFASQIVQGAGITVDDKQPYPFYGWLEAKWVKTVPTTHR